MTSSVKNTNRCYECLNCCYNCITGLFKKKGHKKQDTRIEISVKRMNEEKTVQTEPPKPLKQKTISDLTYYERTIPDNQDHWVKD